LTGPGPNAGFESNYLGHTLQVQAETISRKRNYDRWARIQAKMNELRIVVSLITRDNDFQMEQAIAAEEAARKLGIVLEVLYADGDSIQQSQQILKFVQSNADERPDGIILEPVGATALPQVARAAAASGIAWVVLNRELAYINDLRANFSVPIFTVASDHLEIGRIQAKQLATLLPNGGSVLYIQGPSESDAGKLRTHGLNQNKAPGIQLKMMKANWTEAGAYDAVTAWLRLSTSQQARIDVIAAQNDAMAAGAKKAFQQFSSEGKGRDRWIEVPFIGVDGVPATGQAWVRNGMLTATVIAPPLAGIALEMLTRAIHTGTTPPEFTLIPPESFPTLDSLVTKAKQMQLSKSAKSAV
jgi:ribose transport system substrate-binding protein